MTIGTIVFLSDEFEKKLAELVEIGLYNCQLLCWNETLFTDEVAQRVVAGCEKYGVEITAVWCGWGGPVVWDFYDGQGTLGLVPPAYRDARMKTLLRGSDFAHKLGVKNLVTHVGYVPENPCDANYRDVVIAVRHIVEHCARNGQNFLFETGQETPVTLRRIIQDIALPNVGINLDPANLLMYGKGNPVDALDVFGEYVMGVHGKDGEYPTDGHKLGKEKPIGQGRVNYPAFVAKLQEVGYTGAITIEREISGDQQKKDIIAAKALLEELLAIS